MTGRLYAGIVWGALIGACTTAAPTEEDPPGQPVQDLVPTHALSDPVPFTYLGLSGGLYPSGSAMPAPHRSAGLTRALAVRPLDANGAPSSSGKIVLLSIGMSNTTQEFCNRQANGQCSAGTFVQQALADPAVQQTSLLLVDGAAGGQSAGTWLTPDAANYTRVRDTRLAPAGVTEQQVQVAWVKVANPGPSSQLPGPNADAYNLATQIGTIVRTLRIRYPNLQLVFLSNRTYGGYATTTLNPEPYAYESGFAVKWVIEAQIRQMAGATVDPRAGNLDYNTVAPWLGWGPDLWANGTTPRTDGHFWARQDFGADGTHPSSSGVQKVGRLLLDFLKQSPHARCWFLIGGQCS